MNSKKMFFTKNEDLTKKRQTKIVPGYGAKERQEILEKKNILLSDNTFSIDSVNNISNALGNAMGELNLTINLIKKNKQEIIKEKSYSKILGDYFRKLGNSFKQDKKTNIQLFQFSEEKNQKIYFDLKNPDFNDKKISEIRAPYNKLYMDVQDKFNESTRKFISENEKLIDKGLYLVITPIMETNFNHEILFEFIIPDFLQAKKYLFTFVSIPLTDIAPGIRGYETIPMALNKYLQNIQNIFNEYNSSEKLEMGTIYEYGQPSEFKNLKVYKSFDHTYWDGKLIKNSYISDTNINVPNEIEQINFNLSKKYRGLLENEIEITSYQLGDQYYTGVLKAIQPLDNARLCYQLISINLNRIFNLSVSIHGDSQIKGNLNVVRHDKESILKTDNTRGVTTFQNKVGINQQSHEVKGLLDIDNLDQEMFINLFDELILYSTNSYYVTNTLMKLMNDKDDKIENYFKEDRELFSFANQVAVVSLPISYTTKKQDLKIYHRSNLSNSILESEDFFESISTISTEINQMMPEIKKSTKKNFIFSFIDINVSNMSNYHLVSKRGFIREMQMYFVFTYLDITNLMIDKSYNKLMYTTINYFSSQHKMLNLSSLLITDPEFLQKQKNNANTHYEYLQNHLYFSKRFNLSKVSEIFSFDVTESTLTKDINKGDKTYLINELDNTWVGERSKDLYVLDLNLERDIIKPELKQIGLNYQFKTNSVFTIYCTILNERRLVFFNIIEAGDKYYIVGSGASLNQLIDFSLKVKGDNELSGNLYVKNTNQSIIFKVDNIDQTTVSTYNVGIGTDNPQSVLNIKDTSIDNVISEINVSIKQEAKMATVLHKLRMSNSNDFQKILEKASMNDNENYFALYEIDKNTYAGKDFTVVYHNQYKDWNGKKLKDINDTENSRLIKTFIDFSDQHTRSFMIYDGAKYNSNLEFTYGTKRCRLLFFDQENRRFLLTTGTNVKWRGINTFTNKNINVLFSTIETNIFMVNDMKRRLQKISVYNEVEGLQILNSMMLKTRNIKKSCYRITLDLNNINETVVSNFDFKTLENIDQIKIKEMNFNDKNKWTNFYKNYLNYNKEIKKNFILANLYEDLDKDFSMSSVVLDENKNQIEIIGVEIALQDIIISSLSVEGDARIKGDLVITNQITDKNFLSIDPVLGFVGIGTDERNITYNKNDLSKKNTHMLNISRTTYPVAVCERFDEEEENYERFGSSSGLTVKRSSKLYTFNEMVSYAEKLNSEKTSDSVSNIKYGADISFEISNNNEEVVEIGQIGMVIDGLDDKNNLEAGFQVKSKTLTNSKNLMYIDSKGTAYFKQLNIDGGKLSVNKEGDLLWNDKKIMTR